MHWASASGGVWPTFWRRRACNISSPRCSPCFSLSVLTCFPIFGGFGVSRPSPSYEECDAPIAGTDARSRHASCGAGTAPSLARGASTLGDSMVLESLTRGEAFVAMAAVAVAAVLTLVTWIRRLASKSTPDPWPQEVDEAVRNREAVPICLSCLYPQRERSWL